jgi:inosose dehydratase
MKSLSLTEALQACAEIGYQHVEFALNEGYPTHPATFIGEARQAAVIQLNKLGLQLPCLMVHLSLTADAKTHAIHLETIRTAGRLAQELNPNNPPILETVLGGNPATWEEQKRGMAEQLHEWAAVAQNAQASIAIKAHVRSAASTPERLLWLLESVRSPVIHAAFDYSHFELQGIGLRESLAALLPKTKFIHVKDTVGNADKFEFLLPGKGRTDYVHYFSLLKENGYTGPVCVEVSGQVFNKPDYQPIAAAKSSFATLQAAMSKTYSD